MKPSKALGSVGGRWLGPVNGLLAAGLLFGMVGGTRAEHAGVSSKALVDGTVVSYAPVPELSGRLTITGSDTMEPLMVKLATEFNKRYPDVKIAVEGQGSAAAIREFVIGYSQQRRGEKSRDGNEGAAKPGILASSRELTPEELRAFSSTNGYEPLMIPVAMDAVAIYVHPSNPLKGLTLQQVDAIFGATPKWGLVTAWGQLGLADGWERQPMHLYGRDKNSGTRQFFMRVALAEGELKEEVREMPGTASEILAIARDPLGIGYAGVGIQTSYVRALPLAEQQGQSFITPGPESVVQGTYPLRRHLYLYVNKAPKSELDPVILEFLKFVNSHEGQETVAKAKFYALPSNQVAKNLSMISGGTVTASMPGFAN